MPALQLSATGTHDSLPQEWVNLSAPWGCSSNSDWKCRALYDRLALCHLDLRINGNICILFCLASFIHHTVEIDPQCCKN